ncbi:SipW-dependent-type signal peptide-containing protein [Skermania piniformis]|uniref:SipW-dependent-type signal peptide-containing protein n=1 Tax=Skermania pinensis TaxID=39122 RepID=A0ABX8SCS1_9ACTN|nr:SipW-dependent-type signal peptide-containing protein [Skermania piniformis]QXQ14779.1 SipW-dependent-type signal peptide-containing protein [Skermania piniformis]
MSTARRLIRAVVGPRTRALLTLGTVFGLGAVATLAAWSDTATATSGILSTGTVDLALAGNQGNPAPYAFVGLSKTGMLPGHSVAATLPVQNVGSLPLQYTMTAAGAGTVAQYLTVAVFTGAASNTATTGSCSGGQLGSTVLGATTTVVPTRGPLAATGGNETLCFLVTLSAAAPASAQNQSATATFTFAATAS